MNRFVPVLLLMCSCSVPVRELHGVTEPLPGMRVLWIDTLESHSYGHIKEVIILKPRSKADTQDIVGREELKKLLEEKKRR